MANTKNGPSDAQIISRLRRSRGGLTASQLHTNVNRLREIEGVVEVGRQKTGKAGRPAVLFALAENVEAAVAAEPTTDPSAESREGALA